MRQYRIRGESWPLKEPFVISRMTQYTAEVAVVEISDGGVTGYGEVERADYFEPHLPNVLEALEAARPHMEAGMGRMDLLDAMPAGPARAAIDCALWDLEAKQAGKRVWELAGLAAPKPLETAYTLVLDRPEAMAAAAARNAHRPLLKLKLGGEGDVERVSAVRAAVPNARLMVDANEAWTPDMLAPYIAAMAGLGVELIEQPLPRGADRALAGVTRAVPVCADETCHDRATLA
ncbi:MAG: dipeptide epimerase, partial [Alphaproteobacteria bacterium]|nr:dipeptide epimerase [Alphaproteobacteria bacterium]